ncbi:hypothetical protein KY339_04550, partial [Candidatus Woesearchaeota archaeon]|nr:hypothetical protein [Candidatus Woesearchaeota archaeon]
MNVKNFKELNTALRNSFSAIKKDMQDLKDNQSSQIRESKKLKQELGEMTKNFVSVDKFNVLKIKIGDLNEDIKEALRIKDDMKSFDQENQKRLKELKKEQKELVEEEKVKRNIELGHIKERLQEAERLGKEAVPKTQAKKLIDDLNSEFDGVKQNIKVLEKSGGAAVKEELETFRQKLDKKVTSINQKLDGMLKDKEDFVKRKQVEDLIKDINLEFDQLKERFEEIVNAIEKLVPRQEFETVTANVNLEFKKLESTLKDFA